MNTIQPLNILVVDDHQIVITGIKLLLKDHFPNAVIDGIFETDNIINIIKATRYHLVILDINIPGMDTHNLLHQIKSVRSSTKILIFSMNSEEIFAKRYLKLGVNGYLIKHSPEEELVKAVKEILAGGRYLSPNMQALMSKEELKGKSENVFDSLSKREFEIMKYLITGLGVKEIAAMINVHHSTVSTHKANIYEKTGATNIVELKELVDFNS